MNEQFWAFLGVFSLLLINEHGTVVEQLLPAFQKDVADVSSLQLIQIVSSTYKAAFYQPDVPY